MNNSIKRITQRRRIGAGGFMRSLLSMALGAGLALSLSASAEWRVQDREARKSLDNIDKKLASQNDVGKGDFSNNAKNGEQQGRFEEPPKKFEKADQDKPSSVVMADETRCPQPQTLKAPQMAGLSTLSPPANTSNGIPQQQWQICKEILETERAQFKYSVMMSDLAQKRYERLQEIQRQRGQINNNNVGELDSNTNKMLALLTLIQIDQQQHKTYNDAYAARIAYLNSINTRLGQMAVNGSRATSGNITGGGGTGDGGGNGGGGNFSAAGDVAAMGVMTLAFSENSPIRAKRRND